MKKILLAMFCMALFFACKKSDSPSPQSSSGKLASVRSYNGSILIAVDTFIYNGNGDIISQHELVINPATGTKDSFTIAFTYSGNRNAPSSYTITDGHGTFTYALSYDNQGRIAKDTVFPDPAARSSSFSYPNNNIAYTSVNNGTADTFYLAGNNVVKIVQASIPFDPMNYDVATFTFSGAYANPFYNVGQSSNLRILLTKINAWENTPYDFISQQAYTTVHENTGFTLTLSYTTDPTTGRIIKESYGSYSFFFRYL